MNIYKLRRGSNNNKDLDEDEEHEGIYL